MFYPFSTLPNEIYEDPFRWWWTYPNEIVMDYGRLGESSFQEVRVSYSRLSGVLDGEYMVFDPGFY
ncbi:MAG: hypothetical protein LUD02_08485 [Tannerellaceae bacterium]|nr:hypothetical protein [Tannerellaceae bacterium]